MSNFKVSPIKQPKPLVDPTKLNAFASAAEPDDSRETPTVATQEQPQSWPWLGLDNKKRAAAFSLRLTPMELAQLKFISENTPDSMHEFCLKAVLASMAEKLTELTPKK